MIATFRKVAMLIGPGQRGRWLLVVVMAVVVSVAEAGSTLLVFGLLGLLMGDRGDVEVPVVGDMRAYLPWEGIQLLVALGVIQERV